MTLAIVVYSALCVLNVLLVGSAIQRSGKYGYKSSVDTWLFSTIALALLDWWLYVNYGWNWALVLIVLWDFFGACWRLNATLEREEVYIGKRFFIFDTAVSLVGIVGLIVMH